MTNRCSSGRLNMLSALALIPPIMINGLWIYTFESMSQSNQFEKVKVFLHYFPGFLQNSRVLILLTIIFSIGVIMLSATGFERSVIRSQKIVSGFMIVAAILIFFLQLIYLM